MPPDVGVAVFVSLRSLKDKTRPSPTPTGFVVERLGNALQWFVCLCSYFSIAMLVQSSIKSARENSEQLTSVQLIASTIRCTHRETDFIHWSACHTFRLRLTFTGCLTLLDQFTFGNKRILVKILFFPSVNFHKRS